jgi:hypothetical protein
MFKLMSRMFKLMSRMFKHESRMFEHICRMFDSKQQLSGWLSQTFGLYIYPYIIITKTMVNALGRSFLTTYLVANEITIYPSLQTRGSETRLNL